MRPGEFRILAALAEAPSGYTYSELKERANLSDPVLSEYLTLLKSNDIILQKAPDKRYFLAQAHQKPENLPNDLEKRMQIAFTEIVWEGGRIATVKDEAKRKEIYRSFLLYHLDNISLLILRSLRDASLKDRLNKENIKKEMEYGERIPKLTKKKALRFVKEMANDWEKRMTEYNASIQDDLLNWVVPYVQMLSLAYMANSQFWLPKLEQELSSRFSDDTVEKTYWFKELELIDEQLAKQDPEYAQNLKMIKELKRERDKDLFRK